MSKKEHDPLFDPENDPLHSQSQENSLNQDPCEDIDSIIAEAEALTEGDNSSEIEKLKTELAEAKDRTLRLMAEFDNYRRRTAKEQLELIDTANAKLLEKLAEVLDNFERAFTTENKDSSAEAFEKGVHLIYEQLWKTLSDTGLEQINPEGEIFNPSCQEAFLSQPSETVPEQHVIQVFQKGYRIKNKIIRTAKVIVSSGKP